jgi:probable HAF family extracellular repeat protein
MKTMMKLAIATVFLISLPGLMFGQQVFNIAKVPNSVPDTVAGINDAGQIIVNTGTPTSNTLSEWSVQQGSVPLQLNGDNSVGAATNSAGDIVGAGNETGSNNVQAFIWRPAGGQQWLGTLGNYPSAANAVNASGAVVGMSHNAAQQSHAFLWTESSGMQDLTPDVSSPLGSVATGINASNEVVGYYYPNGATQVDGFTWTQAGGLVNFGSAGTLPMAISDSGTIVGQAPNASGRKHAFSWTQSGGMKDLGTLGGDTSTAQAINNKGWIVGTSLTNATSSELEHGFLWTPSTGMQDFTTLANFAAGVQVYSVAVNDYGDIAVSTQSRTIMLAPKITVTATSSANPSVVGQAVTFTVTFSSIAGPPPDGETITVSANTTVTGTGTLMSGVAQVTLNGFKAGSRPITVTYNGDPYFFSFKTTPITQIVNP